MEDNMVVKQFNVRPVMDRVYCPDCDVELEKDPMVLTTFPATYQYFCPNCGYGYRSHTEYPKVRFIDEYCDDIES